MPKFLKSARKRRYKQLDKDDDVDHINEKPSLKETVEVDLASCQGKFKLSQIIEVRDVSVEDLPNLPSGSTVLVEPGPGYKTEVAKLRDEMAEMSKALAAIQEELADARTATINIEFVGYFDKVQRELTDLILPKTFTSTLKEKEKYFRNLENFPEFINVKDSAPVMAVNAIRRHVFFKPTVDERNGDAHVPNCDPEQLIKKVDLELARRKENGRTEHNRLTWMKMKEGDH